ncbi:hypothetical protein Tco_1529715, partial [Tanacetum coccineum]
GGCREVNIGDTVTLCSVVAWAIVIISRVTVYRGVARDCTRIAFLAELRSCCSLPLCADYAPCGTAELMLFAALYGLGSLRSDWHLVTLGLSER